MRDADMSIGVIKATVCAGPVFVAGYAVADALAGNAPIVITPALAIDPLLFFFSAIFGSLAAILPVLLGTAMLTAIGRGNIGFRHPALWAITGALMTAPWLNGPGQAEMAAFTATGAICALLARSGVRWHDDLPGTRHGVSYGGEV